MVTCGWVEKENLCGIDNPFAFRPKATSIKCNRQVFWLLPIPSTFPFNSC